MSDALKLIEEFLVSQFAKHDGHDIREVEIDEWRCITCDETVFCLITE